MPLDINLFRTYSGGNPDLIRESQRRRYAPVELVDEIIAKDERWRNMTGDLDNMRKSRNAIQKQVGAKMKAKEPCDEMVAEIKQIGEAIVKMEEEQKVTKIELDRMIGKVGNIVEDGVPVSQDEDADNRVERKWGTPRDPAGLLSHHELLWRIGGYEPERGSAVAGHRGYFLRDVGVLLNQAFINYGIAFLRKRNYVPLQPPYMMNKNVMAGVAQLEQFDEELYKVVSGEGTEDKYLIATSEQPICGFHMDEWMDESQLPLRYAGISTCFRKEAGKHGKDTWGIFRVHQFEKVEQFVLCDGDLDTSKAMQDEMIKMAEEFYQSLGFPYHVINIVSGALNNAAIKKLDLECWFPGYNAYRELVSCSNCTDYQARAMEIRCGIKKMGETNKKYVHMLNATLCATGRAICCLLENYQEADGVRVPEVLVPYMGGITFLPFVRDAKSTAPSQQQGEGGGGAGGKPAPPAKSSGGSGAAGAKGSGSGAAPPAAPATTPSAGSGSSGAGAGAGPTASAVVAAEVPAELQPLVAAIGNKAEEVRVLKSTGGGDKDAVKALVDQLIALKMEYREKAGRDFGAPPAAASGASKDKKEKKKEGAPQKAAAAVAAVACQPPAVPVLAPVYTTPAPPRIARALPSAGDKGSDMDEIVALEAKLALFSYAAGFAPSQEDARLIKVVKGRDLTQLPNVARWARQVDSYSAQEMNAW